MTTLLWNRPTQFDVKPSGQDFKQMYKWTPDIRVDKRRVYRIVVDAPQEALDKLLALDSITPATFGYKPLKKPVKMTIDGLTYDLYSIKQGAPK